MNLLNMHFEWNGLRLEQPMNLIMNWLISVACLICFQKLRYLPTDAYLRWWKNFFLLMGISSFFGGLGHLLAYHAAYPLKVCSWSFAALALFAAEMGSFELLERKSHWQRLLKAASLSKVILFISLTVIYFDFNLVKWNSALGFLGIIMPLHFRHYMKTGAIFAIWIVIGILSMSGPALVHGLNIDLHPRFDKDDLSHVMMIITFLILFNGVRRKSFGQTGQGSDPGNI